MLHIFGCRGAPQHAALQRMAQGRRNVRLAGPAPSARRHAARERGWKEGSHSRRPTRLLPHAGADATADRKPSPLKRRGKWRAASPVRAGVGLDHVTKRLPACHAPGKAACWAQRDHAQGATIWLQERRRKQQEPRRITRPAGLAGPGGGGAARPARLLRCACCTRISLPIEALRTMMPCSVGGEDHAPVQTGPPLVVWRGEAVPRLPRSRRVSSQHLGGCAQSARGPFGVRRGQLQRAQEARQRRCRPRRRTTLRRPAVRLQQRAKPGVPPESTTPAKEGPLFPPPRLALCRARGHQCPATCPSMAPGACQGVRGALQKGMFQRVEAKRTETTRRAEACVAMTSGTPVDNIMMPTPSKCPTLRMMSMRVVTIYNRMQAWHKLPNQVYGCKLSVASGKPKIFVRTKPVRKDLAGMSQPPPE